MMNSLMMLFKEFSGLERPSIKESFQECCYPNQEKIAVYLEKGVVKLPSAGTSRDLITGDLISDRHEILTDGEFTWDNSFAYYVRKYNLRLPKEFEEKVLNKPA